MWGFDFDALDHAEAQQCQDDIEEETPTSAVCMPVVPEELFPAGTQNHPEGQQQRVRHDMEKSSQQNAPESRTAEASVSSVQQSTILASRATPDMLQVNFSTIGNGVVAEMELREDVTALQVKRMLEKKLNIPWAEQRLLVGATIWQDPSCLGLVSNDMDADKNVTVVRMPLAACVALNGSRAGTLRVWDVETGSLLQEWSGHEGAVNCVAIRWASQQALSGGDDGIVRVWDLSRIHFDASSTRELAGHQGAVNCIAVAWAGAHAVSGSSDRSLRLWHLGRGKCSKVLTGHSASVTCVALNEIAWKVVSGSQDSSLFIWDLSTGNIVRECHGHVSSVHCVSADQDLTNCASGGWGTLKLWKWDDKQFGLRRYGGSIRRNTGISRSGFNIADLKGHTGPVTSLSMDWQTCRGLTGSEDTTLCFWGPDLRTVTGFRLRPLVLRKHTLPVTCVSVDWSTACAVSGAGDCLWVWNLHTCLAVRALRGPEELGTVSCVAMDRL